MNKIRNVPDFIQNDAILICEKEIGKDYSESDLDTTISLLLDICSEFKIVDGVVVYDFDD